MTHFRIDADVNSHISSYLTLRERHDENVLSMIYCKYAYFLRNKKFHGEKTDFYSPLLRVLMMIKGRIRITACLSYCVMNYCYNIIGYDCDGICARSACLFVGIKTVERRGV